MKNQNAELLSINGLDERQQAEAYKIAFTCFKVLFWLCLIFSFALLFITICISAETETVLYGILAIVMEIIPFSVYTIFAAKSSKIGAMNPPFAKMVSKTSYIVTFAFVGLVYFIMNISDFFKENDISNLLLSIYILIAYSNMIITGLLAKKNNKVAEETEEDAEK